MTELEKLEHAKLYINKLANGINPLDDTALPDTDIVNNVKISRCLFYVSDVLRQAIEYGGRSRKKEKGKKTSFQISYEDRLKFRFSETPVPISEIARRINDLVDTSQMEKLSYKHLLAWLIELGLLSVTTGPDGKPIRHPTSSGTALGITEEQRQGQRGAYTVVVYDRSAQQFILDNLDAVIEQRRQQKAGAADISLQGKPWLPVHDEILSDLFCKRVPLKEIAAALNRTEEGVKKRLRRLGLADRPDNA